MITEHPIAKNFRDVKRDISLKKGKKRPDFHRVAAVVTAEKMHIHLKFARQKICYIKEEKMRC